MADWEYKEDTYQRPREPTHSNAQVLLENRREIAKTKWRRVGEPGLGYSLDENGYPQTIGWEFENPKLKYPKGPSLEKIPVLSPEEAQKQLREWVSKTHWDFPTWLGHHSREGWEVFKISRDFRDGIRERQITWCIFRRMIS